MQNVSKPRIENLADMFIVECVINLSTIASRLDEIRRAQNPQLVTHYGLFEIQLFRNRAHGHFTRKQQMNYADAGRIAKELEELREFKKRINGNILHIRRFTHNYSLFNYLNT